jgi:hypothetical protein
VLYRCTTACSAGSWATNQSCFEADTIVNAVNRKCEYVKIDLGLISTGSTTNTFNTGIYSSDNYILTGVTLVLSSTTINLYFGDENILGVRFIGNTLEMKKSNNDAYGNWHLVATFMRND